MRRGIALGLLFLVSFAIATGLRVPVTAVLRYLPADIVCESPDGSPWAGRCGALIVMQRAKPVNLGALSWSWRPWRLLRARLAFDLTLRREADVLTALVQLTPSRSLEVLQLAGQAPLELVLAGTVPPGWTGRLAFEDVRLRVLSDGRLQAADGQLQLHALQSPRGERWGSFALQVPRMSGGGLAPGALRTIDGPLQVQGTLQLQPDQSWQLDARIGSQDPTLTEGLAVLGPPDAAGLRALSVAGRF